MAMYDVYSHPEFRKYRASICSKATIFLIVMYLITFIAPILIVYRSNGLWITMSSFNEQPDVDFKHQIISTIDVMVNEGNTARPSYLAWSTYPQFNVLHQANLRIPTIKSWEEDSNRDGKKDTLHFEMELPLKDIENVHRLSIIMFFSYKLRTKAAITLQAMSHISAESYLPGSKFSTIGELRFKQRTPIPHKGIDNKYDTELITQGSIVPSDYDLAELFKIYSTRNYTVNFVSEYPVWSPGHPADGRFKIEAQIKYPEEAIVFYTGFWQMIKYALTQYIAILLIFAFLCERLKIFVFSHQIVNTVPIKPFKSA